MRFVEGLSILLLSLQFAVAYGKRSIVVTDLGQGNALQCAVEVPNVYGWVQKETPPLNIDSEVPITILQYHDNDYLEGGEPVGRSDMYVYVKSDCTNPGFVPRIDYEETMVNGVSYTGRISISLEQDSTSPPVELDDHSFLKPTSFYAFFEYISGFCSGETPYTPKPTATPPPTMATTCSNMDQDSKSTSLDIVDGNATSLDGNVTDDDTDDDSTSSSTRLFISVLVTVLLSGYGVLADGHGAPRGARQFLGTLAVTVTILAALAHGESEHGNMPFGSASGRNLEDPTCAINVEILMDGCRRSAFQDSLVDLIVTAPDVRVLGVELSEQDSSQNPDYKCSTNYEAKLTFPVRFDGDGVVSEGRSKTVSIYSIPDGCQRAVEGRPFIDASGQHLQASPEISNHVEPQQDLKLWSAGIDQYPTVGDEHRDSPLALDWTRRALGEHASVAAFAAFTVALMSNNAPPSLVQDSLEAAKDEVRHAQTSFEVASLLMGRTVEPGPIPPSTHQFGRNLTALALATAKEGCIDETLSALVAAYEVDTEIDENPRIGDAIKTLLKDKIRTIAWEETRHSALAWRTIRWVCSQDSDACTAVKGEVFQPQAIDRGFVARFQRYQKKDLARRAWDVVHSALIPIVSGDGFEVEAVACDQIDVERELEGSPSSLMDQMAESIVRQTVCSV